MSKRLRFYYGKGMVEIYLRGANLLPGPHLRSGEALPDVPTAVDAALAAPLGTSPLRELARRRRSAVVLVPDRTRTTPVAQMLPPPCLLNWRPAAWSRSGSQLLWLWVPTGQ